MVRGVSEGLVGVGKGKEWSLYNINILLVIFKWRS